MQMINSIMKAGAMISSLQLSRDNFIVLFFQMYNPAKPGCVMVIIPEGDLSHVPAGYFGVALLYKYK